MLDLFFSFRSASMRQDGKQLFAQGLALQKEKTGLWRIEVCAGFSTRMCGAVWRLALGGYHILPQAGCAATIAMGR